MYWVRVLYDKHKVACIVHTHEYSHAIRNLYHDDPYQMMLRGSVTVQYNTEGTVHDFYLTQEMRNTNA